jgi:hypothetical protein
MYLQYANIYPPKQPTTVPPLNIDAKERFPYRYVDFSATLSETGLTSKTMQNNQIRAFRPMHAQSHGALSGAFFQNM